MDRKAFSFALKASVPVLLGYVTTGIAFGLLLQAAGFGAGWAFLMSLVCYAGSMQFVAINLLTGCAGIIEVIIMTLLINCRHMVYGFSMLDKFRIMGKRKPYMIFSLSDETFSLLCSAEPPKDVDRSWFFFFIALLDQLYWIVGSVVGGLLGSSFSFNTQGIDFAMTALFVVIFVNQWRETKSHAPALAGLACSVVCLLLFGADNFILPALISMVVLLTVVRKRLDRPEEEATT